MELKRRAAYLALCAAQEDSMPKCAEDGPAWDQFTEIRQKETCRGCPLKKLCKSYAETDPLNTWGIWGGEKYPRTAGGRVSRGKVLEEGMDA
jgi:hypothetical protein